MTLNCLMICIALVFSNDLARGGIVSDPIVDFLQKNTNSGTGDLFAGEPWNGPAGTRLGGGHLLRFEVPIGPNGSPILFVGASILSDQKTSIWSAYLRSDNHGYVCVGDNVTFGSARKFYILTPKEHGFLGLAEVSVGKTSFGVESYRLDQNGHLIAELIGGCPRDQDKEYGDPSYGRMEAEELRKKYKLSQEFIPKIEIVRLTAYLQNTSIKWRAFNRTFSVASQPDDTSRSNQNAASSLDQKEASKLWKTVRDKRHMLEPGR